MSDLTSLALELDQETHLRLERLAESRRQTPLLIMHEAIVQYLEREEKREASRQETLDAWKEYQVTGLHVTGDEVIAWLETWGDENELPAPECHK
ncbi:CopG family transcriptional regulator [Massilia violaceinigra]|uniref:CopG family transcriptional regulator n=1 Tax=Massilia violaceinigra TaxID=2045208 RepID=A0A2D2DVU0_9BURK|nr:CopG family ribbon-helix-helix protein [Massilia violaceinigra]ATQ79099.1 CopG family transcriptional regulator [Massilia violaceinigra]